MKAEFYYQNENAPKPNTPNSIGVAIIIEYQDKLLFEKRTDSGLWAFIGGGLEINESLESCAIREIHEETGIIVQEQDLQFIKIYSDPTRIVSYPDGNIRRIVTVMYKMELNEEPNLICSEESLELKWLSKNEIEENEIVEVHKHIIEDYFNSMNKHKV